MKKNNLFKIICFLLLLCVGASFCIFTQNTAVAQQTLNHNPRNFGYVFDEQQIQPSQNYATTNQTYTAQETTIPQVYSLRDDYVLYTQNQNAYGLCWAYTGNMVVTSTVMKATNEDSDFSEAWISTLSSKEYSNLYGDGGHFGMYEALLKEYGLVAECDMPNDDMYFQTKDSVNTYYEKFNKYSAWKMVICADIKIIVN